MMAENKHVNSYWYHTSHAYTRDKVSLSHQNYQILRFKQMTRAIIIKISKMANEGRFINASLIRTTKATNPHAFLFVRD